MAAEAFIQCRVTVETKEKVRTLAARQQLSESALLQRLIDLMLQTAGVGAQEPIDDDVKSPRDARVTIRLRGEDQALLHARAAARGMPSATYVSVLTRTHLRKLTPLPKEELLALKRTVSELGRIGRLLNPIARAAQQGDRVTGPGREDLRALLRVCEGLRDHVKNLLRVKGYSETGGE
jgi:predicted DNA binding CopG/RHH family protein